MESIEENSSNTPAAPEDSITKEKKDANSCMALGAGVGVLGAVSAVLGWAFCPLCAVVAPGLIGVGAYKRLTVRNKGNRKSS